MTSARPLAHKRCGHIGSRDHAPRLNALFAATSAMESPGDINGDGSRRRRCSWLGAMCK